MGTLSANTLFHFTKTKKNLISILQNGFYPRYCLEDPFCEYGERKIYAFPIVCFCDILLSQIQGHSKRYGKYALGLTKEWAKKHGISPVIYTHEFSNFHRSMLEYVRFINDNYFNQSEITNEHIDKQYTFLYSLLLYIKPYEELKSVSSLRRYYDEREWRYSFGINDKESMSDIFIDREEFYNREKKDAANKKMIQYRLDFEPKDIKYIIVPTDKDVLNIREKIIKIKWQFSPEDIQLLTTRIISMERIKEDF
jgi:hypothetical protein